MPGDQATPWPTALLAQSETQGKEQAVRGDTEGRVIKQANQAGPTSHSVEGLGDGSLWHKAVPTVHMMCTVFTPQDWSSCSA